MEQVISSIKVITEGQGFIDITPSVREFIKENNFFTGILILNVLHTSCSLTLNENADPNVLHDLGKYIESIVPYNSYQDLNIKPKKIAYEHFQEGEDDMPAHIKTALTNNSLSLSFQNEKLIIGIWQAIYLWEHRAERKERLVNIHAIGEKSIRNYNENNHSL
tara:strand:- start:1213 stop:1701 length:489 start_codon:yes stop_codon:yes gene_type:complete